FNLVNAIASTSTPFKILIANQFLSPAVKVKIGDANATYIPVVNYLTPTASPPPPALDSNNSFSNSLTTYSRGGVTGTTKLVNMYLNMPLDAFVQKDWQLYWSSNGTQGLGCSQSTDPNCMVGLIPTQTGCVHASTGGYTDTAMYSSSGIYGNLWMNA